MKKISALFIALLLVLCGGITSAYAYFQLEKPVSISHINTNVTNASFSKKDNDYYKVYFFASPYYATGTYDTSSITKDEAPFEDPAAIADSEDNPYNSTDKYMLIGKNLANTTALRNANAIFPDGSAFYASCISIDENKIGNQEAFERYEKRDYSGFIYSNLEEGIENKTSTYVVKTIKGNIPIDVLSGIIAGTMFKDSYGFGPEFVGWTYDMNTTRTRTMYGNNRYTRANYMKEADNRGWGIKSNVDEVGNFGSQGEIDQVSASTSLYYLDHLANANSIVDEDGNQVGADGSLIDDHVIYLYPVFAAKNYDTSKMMDGESKAFIKFRTNPERDENGKFTAEYKQSGEIDYSVSRYTNPLFQKKTSSYDEVNYYIKDLYIDTSSREASRIQEMQLDINMKHGDTSWAEAWNTLISFSQLKEMGLSPGYYNVDICYWQFTHQEKDEEGETKKIQELYQKFMDSNRYVAVFGSRRNDEPDVMGTSWFIIQKDSTTKLPCGYVVGFQKNEEYHMTGDSLNGFINDYDSAGYKEFYSVSLGSSLTQFYSVQNVNLKENTDVSVLIENTTLNTIPYQFSSMGSTELDFYNQELAASSHRDKLAYQAATKVNSGESTLESVFILGDNKIHINKSGSYSFIFTIEYENGIPIRLNVGYKQTQATFLFVILSEKPTNDNFYTDFDAIYESNNFLAGVEVPQYSKVTLDTVLFTKSSSSETDTNRLDSLNLRQFLKNHSNYDLIDSVTGWKITSDFLASGKMNLNRDYIVYLQKK